MSTPLRLLVRGAGDERPAAGPVEMGRQAWRLREHPSIQRAGEGDGYVCVSYVWGSARQTHPFDPRQDVSSRAIAAAQTAAHTVGVDEGIWIDSLCLPSATSARQASLLRMGEIYANARRVIVVLSAECAPILTWCAADRVTPFALEHLEPLARDAWVTRAWTYQEVANSRLLTFVAEGHPHSAVDGERVLDRLGRALFEYRQATGDDEDQLRERYPRLDRLTEVLLDWMITDLPQRTAYRVLAGMAGRVAERPDDVYYAMLGAIDASNDLPAPGDHAGTALHPVERFLRLCESRGDYSFIATTGPRSSNPHWRPSPGPLPVVFPWHIYGPGLQGRQGPTGLTLEDVVLLPCGPVRQATIEALAGWLRKRQHVDADGMSLAMRFRRRLEVMGFSGAGEPIPLESGMFFGHGDEEVDDDHVIAACVGLRWTSGALGLHLAVAGEATYRLVDIGVVVGQLPRSGGTITLQA